MKLMYKSLNVKRLGPLVWLHNRSEITPNLDLGE